jgi:hypothetical protein
MRKTAIMDLQLRIQNKSPQQLRVPKRYQPLWLSTMSSSRQNQLMMSITTRQPVETKDNGTTCGFPPLSTLRTKVGARIPCQGVAAAMTFTLFTAANSGHSPVPAYSILTCTLHWVPYVSTSCWPNRCTSISSQSVSCHAYRCYIATNTYLRRR